MASPQIPVGLFTGQPIIPIALGLVLGVTCSDIVGVNPSVAAGTAEDVWSGGGAWPQPLTVGATASIVSDNAADAAAGTGARTVKVTGLNATYDVVTETLTLDGVTPVVGAQTFITIQAVEVLTVGTGLTNTGTLTVGLTGGPAVAALVLPGAGRAQSAVYVVPRGYQALLLGWQAGIQGVSGNEADLRVFVQTFGGAYQSWDMVGLFGGGTSQTEVPRLCPLPLAEKSIIKLRATSQSGTFEAHGSLSILLFRTA